jgi:hypothetical protein
VDKVSSSDSTEFAKELSKYYKEVYNSERLQNDIEKVRHLRDKFIAHNEAIQTNGHLELQTVRELLKFATEIVDTFSFAFFNSRWTINGKSMITESVEKGSYFINWATDKLIKN